MLPSFLKENLSFVLKDKKILVGITGSIAAFKICDLIRYLRECNAQVQVILTKGGENFVTRSTLETLSGSPVLTDFWHHSDVTTSQNLGTFHVNYARWADAMIIAPATAHFIAKMANGLADDLLSTEILAFQGTVLVAPAMNPGMYAHPAVQENVTKLRERGTVILGPEEGITSCGEVGLGRMCEPEKLVEDLAEIFYANGNGKTVLVTLGPTLSAIDPARILTNRSSGLMGASFCWAAVQSGYKVIAVAGPTQANLPRNAHTIRVQTTDEMAAAVAHNWPSSDILIATAAVLDWKPKYPSQSKLKKGAGFSTIELEENLDILRRASEQKTANQYVLGFAAETEEPVKNGFDKLANKKCDALFANNVSKKDEGFESDANSGWFLKLPDTHIRFDRCSKPELARKILRQIEEER